MAIEIDEVIRKTNVSTLFILPIFSDIVEGVDYKLTTAPFSLTQLAYEYGFIKSFCYSHTSTDNNSLFLVFDKKEVQKPMVKTSKPSQTLNNLLISCKYFNDLFIQDNLCVYNLAIPPEFYDDVALIKKGLYSQVSDTYLNKLLFKVVINKGLVSSELAHKITQQNVAYAVCLKRPRIKQEIERAFTVKDPFKLSDDVEYYQKFSTVKETLTPEVLEYLGQR